MKNLFYLLFVLPLLFSCGSGYDEDSEPDFTMAVTHLCDEYATNKVAANEKYDGKLFLLKDIIVGQVSTSLTGVPQVIIDGGRIYFEDKEDVIDLKPGQKITVKAVLSVGSKYDCQFEPAWIIKK